MNAVTEKKTLEDFVKEATEENPVILGESKGKNKKTIFVDNPLFKKKKK